MKNTTTLFVMICTVFFANAQTKKLTMKEAVNGLRSTLAVENISQFSWSDDEKSYITGTKKGYLITDWASKKKDTLLSITHLKKILPEVEITTMPRVNFYNANKGYFSIKNQWYWIEKNKEQWAISRKETLDEKAQNIKVTPEQKALIYTIDHQLYAQTEGGKKAIYENENPNIIAGQAVHRNEFGITEGIFIAPNSTQVAYYVMDQSMVADYPIIDWSGNLAKNENIKYPMAGKTSHEVSLEIFSLKNNQKTKLNIEGEKDQYLTAVTWSPDSKFIFVGVLNRAQNHLKMNMYNAENGTLVKTLFEEKNEKYVEPQNPLLFFPNSTTDFIWQSQRSGYNHLYHYNTEKGLVKNITQGEWLVTQILGYRAEKNEIYYLSTQDSPLERHLYRVNYKTGKTQKIDDQEGMHTAILSKNGNYIYDSYTNQNTPRAVEIIDNTTLKKSSLLKAENPLKDYQTAQVKNVVLKADDGTLLYGKLMLPAHFDENKKYPTIVYLYNGPHLQLITNSFPASGNLWYDYMTQNGYIIFSMDGRGSSNRGLAFEQAVFRNLGKVEMKDQLVGIRYLQSLPYVDDENMGIHGWSFGGFMTTSFMLKEPNIFKVGVAGGPVIDWNWYETMYTERYMDTPTENPEGYKEAALTDKVQNLKGKLLMIHGAQDDVVVWQHSMKFLKAAVDQNISLDYFVYPGHQHNVLGKDRVHLMQKITDYFDLYLKK